MEPCPAMGARSRGASIHGRPFWKARSVVLLGAFVVFIGPTALHSEDGAAPKAPRDAPAKKSGADKTDAKESSKKKEGGDPVFVLPRISESGYLEALEKMDPQQATSRGVEFHVKVIHDAYRYLLAQKIKELEEAGYEEDALKAKLRTFHADFKTSKGKVLFLASLSTVDGANGFLTQDVPKHVQLTQGRTKTLSVSGVDPKPTVEKWKVFEYPSFAGVKRTTPALGHFNSLKFQGVSSSVKLTEKEPFVLSMINVLAQSLGPDPQNSINLSKRQLSTRKMEDLQAKGLKVTFKPGKGRIPKAPEDFDELVRWLESK